MAKFNDIMVSVIILTYNQEAYIRQALDSILMQKVDFAYEILVGDDDSCDNTKKIIKEYKQRFPDIFRVWLRDKNLGATRNAFELLTQANGKYLATCDGDDYWTDENKLEMQVEFLERHPEYIGCSHKFIIVDKHGIPKRKQHLSWVKDKEIFSFKDFEGLYLPSQPSTFVRRNIFLNPEFDYSILYKVHPMVGDRTLGMIYLMQGKFFCLNRIMSCYRELNKQDGKSITSVHYRGDRNYLYDEYKITCSLEKHAQAMGVNVKFTKRKKEIFCSSIIQIIKKPSKENFFIIKRLVSEVKIEGILLNSILHLPFAILLKIIKYLLSF